VIEEQFSNRRVSATGTTSEASGVHPERRDSPERKLSRIGLIGERMTDAWKWGWIAIALAMSAACTISEQTSAGARVVMPDTTAPTPSDIVNALNLLRSNGSNVAAQILQSLGFRVQFDRSGNFAVTGQGLQDSLTSSLLRTRGEISGQQRMVVNLALFFDRRYICIRPEDIRVGMGAERGADHYFTPGLTGIEERYEFENFGRPGAILRFSFFDAACAHSIRYSETNAHSGR
jgi:hypothetical protein